MEIAFFLLKLIFLMHISIFKIRQNIILKSLYIQIKDKHMMSYKEYNDSLINDANEKSKSKRKLLKSNNNNKDLKSKESERQKEEFEKEEARKEFIQQNMNRFINGPSAFD